MSLVDKIGPIDGASSPEYFFDVLRDRVLAHVQLAADLRVCQPAGDQLENRTLPFCKSRKSFCRVRCH